MMGCPRLVEATVIEPTIYQLSLEDLYQVTRALARRLRFLDLLAWFIADEVLLDLLMEAVQEVKMKRR